ncbi:MAG: hypothetical protein ISR37_05210, partial [Balneolaceae bacterium]|nr:hypothetical protein [Balneolaceae bacterium]
VLVISDIAAFLLQKLTPITGDASSASNTNNTTGSLSWGIGSAAYIAVLSTRPAMSVKKDIDRIEIGLKM